MNETEQKIEILRWIACLALGFWISHVIVIPLID